MANKLELWLPWLFKESMPVWLTILASLGAAGATYLFAPAYNRQFQIEEIRSAHLQKATESLNTQIIILSQKIRRFNAAIVNKDNASSGLRDDCLDLITQLQWQLVDLETILNGSSDAAYVEKLSETLDALKSSLDQPVTPTYVKDVNIAMAGLSDATRDVLDRLYIKASLKVVE